MTLEETLAIVDELVKPERLTILQETIIRQCWFNKTYQQIANEFDYDANYIRGVGSRLWQQLSEACKEEVTKNNFRSVLRQIYHTKRPNNDNNISWELPDGTVPLNSHFYIKRPPLEDICYREIVRPGALLRIKAHQKMGKSSLLDRIMAATDEFDYYKVKLDLQQADSKIIGDFSKLMRWLLANICFQLSLKNPVNCYWDEDLGIKVNSTIYLEDYILKKLDKPLILAIDRLHLVFGYTEVAREFLPLLRFWHEEAKNSTTWQKLRLIVAQTTECYVNLNFHQSPFNVGLVITLPEFDRQQTLELARRYQLTEQKGFKENELEKLRHLVGGHPYLIRLAFYNLAKYNMTSLELIREAATETSIYINVLRYYLDVLSQNRALASAFKKVITADCPVRLETFVAYQLANLGLISLQGNEAVAVCPLYNLYFKERLGQY